MRFKLADPLAKLIKKMRGIHKLNTIRLKKENSNSKSSISRMLNTIFTVDGEMCKDNGEDSFSFNCTNKVGFLATFDGCGGLGARKYMGFKGKTGAYIASRTSAKAVEGLFENSIKNITELNVDITEKVEEEVLTKLKEELQKLTFQGVNEGIKMKGSLTKEFPTTASIIVYYCNDKKLDCSFLWAGDSRGFILTVDGLSQFTKDDIDENEDAFSNLSSDAKLANVVSAEGDFKINSRYVNVNYPAILITSTDGCFNYFSTPMEFEFMIIKTLMSSKNINEWKANLKEYLLQYAGDDYTMIIAAFGWSDYKSLRNAFIKRLAYMQNTFINPLKDLNSGKIKDGNRDLMKKLWDVYKVTYYK